MDLNSFISPLIRLVDEVALLVLPIYQSEKPLDALHKEDGSPVTLADHLANKLIVSTLTTLTPVIPILSEEAAHIDYAQRKVWDYYWLVDPIDGTKEFLTKTDDFTVNIALMHQGKPVLGIVSVPVAGDVYYAATNLGAWKRQQGVLQKLQVRAFDKEQQLQVAVSRRHGRAALDKLQKQFSNIALTHRGSSIKFCLIAEGLIDVYPRLGPTSEWDTAAAQCILQEAGGEVVDLNGVPLRYNQKDSLINPEFIAVGDLSMKWYELF